MRLTLIEDVLLPGIIFSTGLNCLCDGYITTTIE